MKNILQENMRRFRTKNLKEQEDYTQPQDIEDYEDEYIEDPDGTSAYDFVNQPLPKLYKMLEMRKGLKGKITPREIQAVLNYSIGNRFPMKFNDKEALIQSAFHAIPDKKTYMILDKAMNLRKYLEQVFSPKEYNKDFHGNGRIPTVMDTLKRLGEDTTGLDWGWPYLA